MVGTLRWYSYKFYELWSNIVWGQRLVQLKPKGWFLHWKHCCGCSCVQVTSVNESDSPQKHLKLFIWWDLQAKQSSKADVSAWNYLSLKLNKNPVPGFSLEASLSSVLCGPPSVIHQLSLWRSPCEWQHRLLSAQERHRAPFTTPGRHSGCRSACCHSEVSQVPFPQAFE